MSTTEAEFIAFAVASREAMWLINLLKNFCVCDVQPVQMLRTISFVLKLFIIINTIAKTYWYKI